MKFEELLVLLPCHSLEDFPLYSEGEDADGLLAAWSALWHPALLAAAHKVPGWARVDCPPLDIAGRLMIVPQVGRDQLPSGFADRCKAEGAVLIRKPAPRNQLVAWALEALDGGSAGISDAVAADFLALGFARLQIELLTRQMRYTSHIDESQLEREVLLAADAAIAQDSAEVQIHLQKCFDVLYESRKYFYPVDAYLLDLTLVASTTIGATLREELTDATASGISVPVNLLVAAEVLELMAQNESQTLANIRQAWTAGQIGLAGGEASERELPLLPLETILADLKQGVADYERLLGKRPAIYGRRRYGLSPLLPQLLTKLGYTGALHVTLDDGHFPLGTQSKTRWEGLDSSAIEAVVRLPRDAAKPETFLDFSRKLGESMDMDHVATVIFAHWPGAASPWYADLRRIARFTPALGKFVTLEEYFGQTDFSGRISKFAPDDYRAPYLKQAIIRRQPNPISGIGVNAESAAAMAESAAAMAVGTLAALLGGSSIKSQGNASPPSSPTLSEALSQFAAALPRQGGPATDGLLAVNPLSFARRIGYFRLGGQVYDATRPELIARALAGAGENVGSELEAGIVDVPAMGFAWRDVNGPDKAAKHAKKKASRSEVDDQVLRNEYMEVTISKTTGGIASIYDFRSRANRLSQQLGLRSPGPRPAPGELWRDPDEDVEYSVMVADQVEKRLAHEAGTIVVSSGRLVDRSGKQLARFEQVFYLAPGSRQLQVYLKLEADEEPRADPWNSYYALRFAWHDATADLARSLGLCRVETDAKRIESPGYVEIVAEKTRTSIVTQSLPYHRRVGMRMLDTLLKVRGETNTEFRYAIGIDLPNPAQAALQLASPETVFVENALAPPVASSGWLFHVDARNVVATHWAPLLITTGESSAAAERVGGARVRLLETLGQAGRVTLRCFRSVAEAHSLDYQGEKLAPLIVEDDKIVIEFGAYEWLEIEAVWK